MTCFQQMVLDYLEHYQPETYARLAREHSLRAHVRQLTSQLYEMAEREFHVLSRSYSDRSEEDLRSCAEEAAMDAVLPMIKGEPM